MDVKKEIIFKELQTLNVCILSCWHQKM